MDLLEAILLTVRAAKGHISGRTAIQKLVYFESVKNIISTEYRPHYYGPYSADVASTVQNLVALKFLVEEEVGYADQKNHWKVYRYVLTVEGKKAAEMLIKKNRGEYKEIEGIVKTCKRVVNLEPNTLSWAAKAYYIISKGGRAMTCEEIKADAEGFGWKIPGNVNIDNAVNLLDELGLCATCTA